MSRTFAEAFAANPLEGLLDDYYTKPWNDTNLINLYSCVITPPAARIASFAWSTMLSGVSFGYETMTAFWGCTTAIATVKKARIERMVNFMAFVFFVFRYCWWYVEEEE